MSLTDAQLAERTTGIGGSDAPALMGVNPPRWAQPIDVWLSKLGLENPREANRMQAMGSLLEPVVAKLFAEATGLTLRRQSRMLRSKRWPWAVGHVDRRVQGGGVYEGKWGMNPQLWGATGSSDVPDRVTVQVQHYLAVTGDEMGWAAVMLGYADFRWYQLPRNEQLIEAMMEVEGRFWHDYVLTGQPPPPDGSEAYTAALRQRLGLSDGTEAVATPEVLLMADELRDKRQLLEAAKAEHELAQQHLMLAMGNATTLRAPGIDVRWASGERRDTDWRGFVEVLLERHRPSYRRLPTKKAKAAALYQAAAAFTTTKPTRPFVATFEAEED